MKTSNNKSLKNRRRYRSRVAADLFELLSRGTSFGCSELLHCGICYGCRHG